MRERNKKSNVEKNQTRNRKSKESAARDAMMNCFKNTVQAIREMDESYLDAFLSHTRKNVEKIPNELLGDIHAFMVMMMNDAIQTDKKLRSVGENVKPKKPSQEEHEKEICAIIGYISKEKDVIGKTHDVIEQIKTLADEGVPGTSYEVNNLRESCRVKEVYYQKDDVNISIIMRREKQRS